MRDFPQSFQHASGVVVDLDQSRALLVFSRPPARRGLEETLAEYGLALEVAREGTPDVLGEVINHNETHYWVRSVSGDPIEDRTLDGLEGALGQRFGFVSPVYRAPGVAGHGGFFSPLANVLLIRPPHRAEGEPMRLDGITERLGLREDAEKSRYLVGYRYFYTTDPRNEHMFRARERLLAELPGAELQFETMPMVVPVTVIPNDPLFFRQWDMTRIDAPAGWDISTGTGANGIKLSLHWCKIAAWRGQGSRWWPATGWRTVSGSGF